MKSAGYNHSVIAWRHGLAPMVLLLLSLLLAACTGGNLLNDNGTAAAPGPVGKTPPPVILQPVVGVPPDKIQVFKDALALTAGQHDIGIVEGALQSGTFSLAGQFRSEVKGGLTEIFYKFELRDDASVLIDTVAGSIMSGAATPGDPSAAISEAVLQQVAGQVSRQISGKLALMGYATRRTSLIAPPLPYFVQAKNGAQFDIDLETLNGPNAAAPVLADGAPDKAGAAAEPVVPPPPEPGTAKPGQVEINVVAVVAVEGSPGTGNDELTEAMRRTLKAAGWPVVNAPRADALVVRGKVKLAKANGNDQQVSLRWAVETPQGKTLGEVKQANTVPAGSLDAGWGGAEVAVTEAAAGGIFDIIKKFQ